jgi:hypothetical protein
MATKEDILEQIVEEYLVHNGYFVRHNVKFLPRRDHPDFVSNQDSNHSDIDVLGLHPKQEGHARVVAVTCKSWQGGFNINREISAIQNRKILRGRDSWKAFRELTIPKWADAFVRAIKDATGSDQFTYVLAVAHMTGDRASWQDYPPFLDAIGGNPIQIITFQEMIADIDTKLTRTLASTEVGRMLQMFRAAKLLRTQ